MPAQSYVLWRGTHRFTDPIVGKVGTSVLVVSSNYTVQPGDDTIQVDASAAARTITLPAVSSVRYARFRVQKIDSSNNSVTISPQAGETIGGGASVSISNRYDLVEVVAPPTGTDWVVLRFAGGGGSPQWTKVTTTFNPGTLLAGQYVTTTVGVAGAAVGQPAVAAHDGITNPAVVLSAAVTSAGTVTVAFINLTGVAVTIPSGTLTVAVLTG